MINLSLTKIYGRLEHLFNNIDNEFLVTRLCEMEKTTESSSLFRLCKVSKGYANKILDEYVLECDNKANFFTLTACKTNDKDIYMYGNKYTNGADIVVGYYFPPDEYENGEEIKCQYKNHENKPYWIIKPNKSNKIIKAIDNLHYYIKIKDAWDGFSILNPLCKTIYIVSLFLNTVNIYLYKMPI